MSFIPASYSSIYYTPTVLFERIAHSFNTSLCSKVRNGRRHCDVNINLSIAYNERWLSYLGDAVSEAADEKARQEDGDEETEKANDEDDDITQIKYCRPSNDITTRLSNDVKSTNCVTSFVTASKTGESKA